MVVFVWPACSTRYTAENRGGIYPASGIRASHSGALGSVGTNGYAWSSSPSSATSVYGSYLDFYSSNMNPENHYDRAYGFPVRCVQE